MRHRWTLLLLLGSVSCFRSWLLADPFAAGVDPTDAVTIADEVASDPDADAAALSRAAWVAVIHEADDEKASRRWTRALTLDPGHALAHFGLGEAARARLDHPAAIDHYLDLLELSGETRLAQLALRSLATVIELAPRIEPRLLAALEQFLGRPGAHPPSRPLARQLLARVHRLTGALERGAELQRTSGAPLAWTLAGPFSPYRSLDAARRFDPEREQRFRARYTGPLGDFEPRITPAPRGTLTLGGEPRDGDVYYAMVDFTLPNSGRFLLRWQGDADLRLAIDGTQVLTRPDVERPGPGDGLIPLLLSTGTHRIVVRMIRDYGEGRFRLEILDDEGHPAKAKFQTENTQHPPKKPATWPDSPRRPSVVQVLEPTLAPATPVEELVALLLLRDDGEAIVTAQSMLERMPHFAWVRYRLARLVRTDPDLPEALRSSVSASLIDEVLEDAPAHGGARLLAAEMALEQSRYDDAEELLDALDQSGVRAASVARARSRLWSMRGLPVLSRQALEEALAHSPSNCRHWQAVYRTRLGTDDLGGTEAAAAAVRGCGREGLSAWADHQRDRGDLDAAVTAYHRLVADDPTRISATLALARLLRGQHKEGEARAALEGLRKLWPRSAAPLLPLATLAALRGDDEGARRLREEALRLEPSDLSLRRALHGTDRELLDWGALDLEALIAVYEAEHPDGAFGADAVLVVDHAVVEPMAEDLARPVVVERVQTVTQVLTKQGIDRSGEVTLPDGASLVALYVRKADGRVLEPEDTTSREQISMPGLDTGDFIVVDYLVSHGPRSLAMPGWTANTFYLRVFDLPLYRSSYTARAPVELGLEVDAHHVEVEPPHREGGFLVFSHEVDRAAAVQAERGATGADEYLPWIRLGSGARPESYGTVWGDFVVGRASAGRHTATLADRFVTHDPEAAPVPAEELVRRVARAVGEVVRGTTRSTELSDRGEHALARGRGNRLLATKAVLGALGIESRVALIRPFGANPARLRFPTGDRFTYAVLRVDLGARHLWLDQNIRTAPVGRLRPVHSGQPALLLADQTHPAEVVNTPKFSLDADLKEVTIELSLDREGNLEAKGIERYRGFPAAVTRLGLEPVGAERRRQVVEASLAQNFGQLALGELSFEGDDPSSPPGTPFTISYEFEAPRWARTTDAGLTLPGSLFPARLSRQLIQLASRNTPLLMDTELAQSLDARLHVPDGLVLTDANQKAVLVDTPFGRFERQLSQDGDTVTVRETLSLSLTRVQPDEYEAFVRFCAEVDEAQMRPVTLEAAP